MRNGLFDVALALGLVSLFGGCSADDNNTNDPPTLAITQPDGNGDTADGTFRIELAGSDADSAATISLSYSPSAVGADAVAIVAELSTDTTFYDWDTSTVPAGTYYVHGVIADERSSIASSSRGPVAITHRENIRPTITVGAPDGVADTADAFYLVEFQGRDPDSVAVISLYTDRDNSGEDGILIASGISEGTTSYLWDTTSVPVGAYYVYAVIDGGHASANAYSPGQVTIAHGNNLTPSVIVSQPDGVDDQADATYRIELLASDPDSIAAISLYYDRDGSGEDGTLIASGLAEGSTYYLWDTRNAPSGSYYVYAVVDDGLASSSGYGSGPVTIHHPGDTPPTISIAQPDGVGDTADTTYRIELLGADPDSNALISLYFDADGSGEDGTLIASSLAEETTSYLWDTSELGDGTYYIYAVIDDGRTSATDYGAGPVMVAHPANVAPTIAVTQPDGIGDSANATYRIGLTSSDPDSEATISLYYDTDDAGLDGTLIVSDLAEGATYYDWNTTAIPAGAYYVYAVAQDELSTVAKYSTGAVAIAHGGNISPTITVSQPDGAGDTADTSFHIELVGSDPDSAATISLYYDSDRVGEDGALIVSGLAEATRYYDWDTTAVPEGSYYVYGVIDDGEASSFDYSPGAVSVTHPPACERGTTVCSDDGFGLLACGFDPLHPTRDSYGPKIPCEADVACLGGTCQQSQCLAPEVMILLDRSSSIKGDRFTWVKEALVQALDHFAHYANIGFRQFPSAGCAAGDIIPLALDNAAHIKANIVEPTTDGATPIAAALDGLAPSYGDRNDSQIAILISDGGESCQESAEAVQKTSELFRAGVFTHAIGVTTQADATLLDEVAKVGGTGTSKVVNSKTELFSALETIFFATHMCCPSLSIANTTVQDAVYDQAYSDAVVALGGYGTLGYALTSGALPEGINLSASTGAISGTPTTVGDYTFKATVSDVCPRGAQAVSQTYTMKSTADCAPLAITTAAIPRGTYGVSYATTIEHTGGYGTLFWSVASGALPSGLAFAPSTQTLSGTPQETGDFTFSIQGADQCPYGSQIAEKGYDLPVVCGCPALSMSTATLPEATYAVVYKQTIKTSGGSGTVSFSIASGSLPSGLTLNSSTGVLSGTPTELGDFTFTIRAQDQCNCPSGEQVVEHTFTVPVTVTCSSLGISTASVPDCIYGKTYSASITPTGGYGTVEVSITSGRLPNGLSMSTSGQITGTCNEGGDFSFEAQAQDSCPKGAQTYARDYSMRGYCNPLTFVTAWTKDATLNQAYDQPLSVTGGHGTVTLDISYGALPPGLALSSVDRKISGTPTQSGQYSFVIRATDQCPLGAQAQGRAASIAVYKVLWQQLYGGSADDGAGSVIATSDGGILLAGGSGSTDIPGTTNHGSSEAYLVNVSSTGTTQWQKLFGGTSLDGADEVKEMPGGGYVFAGTTYASYSKTQDFMVIKTNSSGSSSGTYTFGGSYSEFGHAIDLVAGGGFIVAGTTMSKDIPGLPRTRIDDDGYIVNLSSTGSIQWQKVLGGTDDESLYSIRSTADGGFIVAGKSLSTDIPDCTNHGAIDVYVAKLDTHGAVTWQVLLGGSGDEGATSVEPTSDGGYIVAGSSESADIPEATKHGGDDFYVVKLDADGVIEWQKLFGGSGSDYAYSVKPTSDGGYIVAGDATSTNIADVRNRGGYDAYVVKLDETGALQWQAMIGGSGYDYASSIVEIDSGVYVMAGSSDSTDIPGLTSHRENDAYVVKFSF